jgi:aspartate/methionine/tyrosine aminotransferase
MIANQTVMQLKGFLAMDVLAEANRLAGQGVDVARLEVGEPDRGPPPHVAEAMQRAVAAGKDGYTSTEGIPALREAIAGRYLQRYGVKVDPERILVTMGVSPALALVFSLLLERDAEVLYSDPGYPCYPNVIRLAGGRPRPFPLVAEEGFHIDVDRVLAEAPGARVFLLNSPSNPTGAVQPRRTLEVLVRRFEGLIVSDEIYHDLTYGTRAASILELTDEAIVVDGFSKRFGMTGWRLGWLVVPEPYVRALRVLHQNTMLSATEFVQEAGLAMLRGPQECVEEMVADLGRRRRAIIDGLRAAGLKIAHEPEGAFYVLADARAYTSDSLSFAFEVLREAHVACAPGVDFGAQAEGFLRFSYATSMEHIEKAVERLTAFLAARR